MRQINLIALFFAVLDAALPANTPKSVPVEQESGEIVSVMVSEPSRFHKTTPQAALRSLNDVQFEGLVLRVVRTQFGAWFRTLRADIQHGLEVERKNMHDAKVELGMAGKSDGAERAKAERKYHAVVAATRAEASRYDQQQWTERVTALPAEHQDLDLLSRLRTALYTVTRAEMECSAYPQAPVTVHGKRFVPKHPISANVLVGRERDDRAVPEVVEALRFLDGLTSTVEGKTRSEALDEDHYSHSDKTLIGEGLMQWVSEFTHRVAKCVGDLSKAHLAVRTLVQSNREHRLTPEIAATCLSSDAWLDTSWMPGHLASETVHVRAVFVNAYREQTEVVRNPKISYRDARGQVLFTVGGRAFDASGIESADDVVLGEVSVSVETQPRREQLSWSEIDTSTTEAQFGSVSAGPQVRHVVRERSSGRIVSITGDSSDAAFTARYMLLGTPAPQAVSK